MKKENREKIKILFLCTGNSCRSQMAEGWTKHLKSDEIDAYSAGVKKHGLNPLAVTAMNEAGVDISKNSSKTIDELPLYIFTLKSSLGGTTNRTCFSGGRGVNQKPELVPYAL